MNFLARLTGDLRALASDADRQTDMASPMPLPPPASIGELRRAEVLIGCALPAAIATVYSGVANGGFGPGYGLVGIGGGCTGFADRQGQRHCEDQYSFLRQNVEIKWPVSLLPLCDWGCGIYSCADTSRPEAPMSTAFGDLLHDDPAHAVVPAGCTFAQWLRAWADGEDLWEALIDSIPPAQAGRIGPG